MRTAHQPPLPLRRLSFFDPTLSGRLRVAAFLCVCAQLPALASVARALWGGRYQVVRGIERDLWAEAALLSLGFCIASVLAAVLGRWWRHRGRAALLAALCVLAVVALSTIAEAPHGPAPYQVRWGMSLTVSVIMGAIVAWSYDAIVRQVRDSPLAAAARRRAGDAQGAE